MKDIKAVETLPMYVQQFDPLPPVVSNLEHRSSVAYHLAAVWIMFMGSAPLPIDRATFGNLAGPVRYYLEDLKAKGNNSLAAQIKNLVVAPTLKSWGYDTQSQDHLKQREAKILSIALSATLNTWAHNQDGLTGALFGEEKENFSGEDIGSLNAELERRAMDWGDPRDEDFGIKMLKVLSGI